MIEVLVGVLLALVMVCITNKQRRFHKIYALGLISLPFIYVVFALVAGDGNAIGKELFFGAPFIFVGALCLNKNFKGSALLLAAFWLTHGVYDIYHELLFVNAGTPNWYPAFCAAFDVVIGVYLIYKFNQFQGFNIKTPDHNE